LARRHGVDAARGNAVPTSGAPPSKGGDGYKTSNDACAAEWPHEDIWRFRLAGQPCHRIEDRAISLVRSGRLFAADDRHSYSKFAQALQVSVRKRPLSILEEPAWVGSVRPRLGYAMGPLLFYGTGGLAYANLNLSNFTVSNADLRLGWTAGAGIEYMLYRNLSLRLEYLHTNLGPSTNSSDHLTDNVVRLGINFRF